MSQYEETFENICDYCGVAFITTDEDRNMCDKCFQEVFKDFIELLNKEKGLEL